MLGNFLGDFVKRRDFSNYSEKIVEGIELHHQIDRFTDQHHIVSRSKQRLRPSFRHYSSVIVDIFYDHFLALHWHKFSDLPLQLFTDQVYQLMQDYFVLLPSRTQYMLPYMVKDNWLLNYSKMQGIERVFDGMARRSSFKSGMEKAPLALQAGYREYEKEFMEFFPHLIDFVRENKVAGESTVKNKQKSE
nr:acyl carrier protein phosphodiesterase [Xanthovirga aplysinae]